jgi:uncharacterized protein YcfJ
MKKLAVATLSALGALSGAALATPYGDVARVVSSEPIYRQVSTPRQECRTEQVTAYEQRQVVRPVETVEQKPAIGAGTVLGAIVGGVIGHQFGHSSGGRDRGTAAGAIVGGLVGNSVDRDNGAGTYQTVTNDVVTTHGQPVTRDVQRCTTVSDVRDEVVGYNVRYEYAGREFTTQMPYDPGAEMPVNVDVRPPVDARPPLARPSAPRYY